ncbi:MAG: hypothetical protein ABFC94_13755 [Syntrophomonas sp.]
MRILFCNIANMKYYKGKVDGVDEPQFGGEYVLRTGDAHEKYNFDPVEIDGKEVCLGFFETKSTNRVSSNQLHIEKIEGSTKSDKFVENVLVVWCAKYDDNRTVVVGWYKNATVYRCYKNEEFENGYTQSYNVIANAEDCVLIPRDTRNVHIWQVPRKKYTRSFGFGQANVWFANEETAQQFINKLVSNIENYEGENWLRKYPE